MASLDCRTPPNLICIMDLHCSKPTRNRRHLDISSETCTIPGPAPMMPWESNKSSQESISCIVHQHITATDFKPRDTKGPTLCSMSASAAASTDVSPVLTDADWLSQTSRPGSGTFPATTMKPAVENQYDETAMQLGMALRSSLCGTGKISSDLPIGKLQFSE